MKKSVFRICIEKVLSLLIFLGVLWIGNLLIKWLGNEVFVGIVNYLNETLVLWIGIWLVLFLGELLINLKFPFNLPGPIVNALGGYFTAFFVLQLLQRIGILIGEDILNAFILPVSIIYFIVFVVVLTVGYVKIFYSAVDKKEEDEKKVSWDNVGDEFRSAMAAMFGRWKKKFSKGKKEKNERKKNNDHNKIKKEKGKVKENNEEKEENSEGE